MAKHRVLVSVPVEFKGRRPAGDLLEEAGYEVVYMAGRLGKEVEAVRAALVDIDAVLPGMEPLNAATMESAERMKIIARNGVGYDAVDVPYCTERGIVLTTTPGALSDAVAEETFGLILALTRHIALGDRTVKGGEYDVPYGEDLAAMTLGVIGGGHIGGEVIRLAKAFKMQVLVYDPYADAARVQELGGELVALDELLPRTDIVTFHLPLTPESQNMVNAEFLAKMKQGSYLVNTARGGVVDEPALLEALQNGHLAGAGLDVQASEPAVGVSLELVKLENVVAMPHSGSKTYATRERMSMWAAQSIVDMFQGKTPEHVVNREVLEKLDLKAR
jgi:phosphoglycerate dehydrogenase-like enzyme